MKPRLAASISALMAAKISVKPHNSFCFRSTTAVFSSLFNFPSSFQFKRFKSSKGLLFKVCNDDDDISELGPPVEKAIGQLNLVTEKPDPFLSQKLDNGGKVSSSESPRSKSKQNKKGRILNLEKSHQASGESGNCDDASASTCATSDSASTNSWMSISVGNTPSTVSLSELLKAVSIFGNVCSASVRHVPDGLNCWDIQFESLESCNRAIEAGVLTVGRFRLPILPLPVSKVVTIRLKGITKDASFSEIHSICKSIGTTDGLAWLSEDQVDASFTVENGTELQSILKRLNGTTVGGHCLSASLLPSNSSSASISENENPRCKMALQINSYLTELRTHVEAKKLLLSDLELLHQGIMHLEDLPTIIDPPTFDS